MARLLKKRRARKQAEEAARKQSIQDLKLKNQAKREAKKADMAALAEAKKSKSPGSASAAPSRVTVDGKTYTSQKAADMAKFRKESKAADERTKRGRSNIKSRRSVEIGETYERTNPDGTKRKMIKRDKSKPSQQNNQAKPTTQTSSSNNSEFSKTFSEERKKQGAGGKFAFKGKEYTTNLKEEKESNTAKNGGALAIMIAPVKTKKMKAVKKAPGGASMKKMPNYKKGGALKSVPSEAKGLSKLPKSVRNKMGYMKNGGKVTDPKKTRKEMRSKRKPTDPNINSKTGLYYRKPGGAEGNKPTKPTITKTLKRVRMKKMKNGGKVTDPPTKKKVEGVNYNKKVKISSKTKDKTGNKNFRSDAVSSYLKGLDKNSKEYKETVAYMNKMGIGQ
tara:strand:+ start:309 stop:1481 length:1173 start_codon:yes stop_codon:yes gene_type:complete